MHRFHAVPLLGPPCYSFSHFFRGSKYQTTNCFFSVYKNACFMYSPSLAGVYPLVWGPCGLACLAELCRGQFADTQIQNISRDTQIHKYMETQIHIVPICKYTLDTHFDRTQKYKVCSVPICEYTEQKSWVWPYLIQFARKSARIKSRVQFQILKCTTKRFKICLSILSQSCRKWIKRDKM